MGVLFNAIDWGSGFNITATGPIDNRMRVEYLRDLYDIDGDTCVWNKVFNGTNVPSYAGMVVSVLEDNKVYMLKTGEDGKPLPENEKSSWQVIGSASYEDHYVADKNDKVFPETSTEGLFISSIDVDKNGHIVGVETGSIGSQATTEDIRVIGGPLADEVNFDVIPAGTTLEGLIKMLFNSRIFPVLNDNNYIEGNLELEISGPTISASNATYNKVVVAGTEIKFNTVTAPSYAIKEQIEAKVTGLEYGYSPSLNVEDIRTGKEITSKMTTGITEGSTYKLTPSKDNFIGDLPASGETSIVSVNLVANFGTNEYSVKVDSPSVDYSYNQIPSYYIVSNMGDLNKDEKINVLPGKEGVADSVSASTSFYVTGVYPAYTNISGNTLIDDATAMRTLTTGNSFIIENVPSEGISGNPFMFDFPSNKTISSFEIKQPDVNNPYTDFSGGYTIGDSPRTLIVNGTTYTYKRLKTDGLQGAGNTYKITLNSSMSTK